MRKIWNICLNLWQRIDWHPNGGTWLEVILLTAIWPLMRWADPVLFTEDGWVENIQLLVLIAAMVFALRAEHNRSLFVLAAFVAVFMIMRETNMFRGYLCMMLLPPQEICKLEAFRYGYLLKAVRWVFVLYVLYYFISRKVWKTLIEYIKKAPIFIWDFLVLGLMIIGGTIAEFASIDNEIMEECCELICYIAVANCIWRYRQVKI